MPTQRRRRIKHVRQLRPSRAAAAINVRRGEFNAVIKLLNEHADAINALRQELQTMCERFEPQIERNRRTLDVQFARIAQIQQAIDALTRK